MKTSKYTVRKQIKREARTPEMAEILAEGRKERAQLERLLTERALDNKALRGFLQRFVDAGGWHDGMEKFGFIKSEASS